MSGVLELFSLKGRTVLITGATRGIGQSLALALAEAGADIVLIQRDTSNTATKQKIETLGRKATIYTADLADRDQLRGIVKKVLDDGHDIDTLVNCGGIQRRYPAHEFPDKDWDDVSGRRICCKTVPLTHAVGPASQPHCCLHPLSRCWGVYAHERAQGQPTASRLNHQHRLAYVVPRRLGYSGVRRC